MKTVTPPPANHLSLKQLFAWCKENGVGRYRVTKWISLEIIKRKVVVPGEHALYNAAQVHRDALSNLEEEDA